MEKRLAYFVYDPVGFTEARSVMPRLRSLFHALSANGFTESRLGPAVSRIGFTQTRD